MNRPPWIPIMPEGFCTDTRLLFTDDGRNLPLITYIPINSLPLVNYIPTIVKPLINIIF